MVAYTWVIDEVCRTFLYNEKTANWTNRKYLFQRLAGKSFSVERIWISKSSRIKKFELAPKYYKQSWYRGVLEWKLFLTFSMVHCWLLSKVLLIYKIEAYSRDRGVFKSASAKLRFFMTSTQARQEDKTFFPELFSQIIILSKILLRTSHSSQFLK